MNNKRAFRSNLKVNPSAKDSTSGDLTANYEPKTPGPLQSFYNGKDLCNLYNIPSVKALDGKTKTKIATIGWGSYPGLIDDLGVFWNTNFPNDSMPSVTVHTMPGAEYSLDFTFEECLDLQTICAINPNADIYVIEATSNNDRDLSSAIKYATETLKVDVISMSWGGDEFVSNMFMDPVFTNTNVCYCASSGDEYHLSHPSSNPNVICVGGTAILPIKNNSRNYSEYTWDNGLKSGGAGDGYSTIYEQPRYQKKISGIDHTYRAVPDVSLIADPYTGVNIYCSDITASLHYEIVPGWIRFGGTSLSCPVFAGIASIANQIRFNLDKPSLTSVYDSNLGISSTPSTIPSNNLQTAIYNIPGLTNSFSVGIDSKFQSNDLSRFIFNDAQINSLPSNKPSIGRYNYSNCFNDINSKRMKGGSSLVYNDVTEKYERIYTKGGYDLITGLGSPNAVNLCDYLSTI